MALLAVAACLAVLLATVSVLALRSWQTRSGTAVAAPSYAVGETIDVGAETYGTAGHTLLIFARSTCAACQGAKSMLASIVASVASLESVAVAMVTSAAAPSLTAEVEYAREIGVTAVVTTDTALLRLRKIPAVALVDAGGQVLAFREGLLDQMARDEIVQVLGVPTAVVR